MTQEHIGPYKVVGKLGEGGMGEVFEALHETIEKRVAIKILHPEYARTAEFATRFFNEARAVNRVDHPGLVQVNDYGQLSDGTAYIVMELLRGETLGARLKRTGGDLPLADAMGLLRQIAAALAAAHAKGIVHRDLKPDNVMIVPDPEAAGGERAKLLDFGIAKLVEEKVDEKQVRTRTNQLIGTPRYMSPEQCRGAGGVDDRTDVYSLGVIMYQVLARRPPFVSPGSGELMAMHIYEPPPPLEDVPADTPPALVQLVYRMLAKDKTQRPSMEAVLSELGTLFARPGGRSSPSYAGVAGVSGSGDASGSVAARSGTHRPARPEITDEHESDTADVSAFGGMSPRRNAGGGAEVSQSKQSAPAVAPARPRSRLLLMFSAIALTSVTIAGALMMTMSSSVKSKEKPQPSEPKSVPSAAPTITRWAIDSDPTDAEIVRISDGAIVGRTPWVREQTPATGTLQLRLRHPGYAERLLTLDLSVSVNRKETLDPVPAQPAAAVATPPPTVGSPPVATPATPKRVGTKKRPPSQGQTAPTEKIEIE